MFCNNCGEKLDGFSSCCPKCGAPVGGTDGRGTRKNGAIEIIVGVVILAVILLLIVGVTVVKKVLIPKLSSQSSTQTSNDEDEDDDESADTVDGDVEAEDEDFDGGSDVAEAVGEVDQDTARTMFMEFAERFEEMHEKNKYPAYLKKTDYFEFDVHEVPAAEYAYYIYDFDNDDMVELLTCSLTNDSRIMLDMYEILNGDIILSSRVDLSEYGYRLDFPGEYEENIFFWTRDGQILIGVEFSGVGGLISDGMCVSMSAFSYNDSFSLVNNARYEGSDGEPMSDFDSEAASMGVYYNWSELGRRQKMMSDYLDNPHYVGSINCHIELTYDDLYRWSDNAFNGDLYKVGEIYLSLNEDGSIPSEIQRSSNGSSSSSVDYRESSGEYILEGSDYRRISEDELYKLDASGCRYARNEIYARHGRMFDDEELTQYFSQFSWYNPTIPSKQFQESELNEFEIYNRDLIVKYEKDMGYR